MIYRVYTRKTGSLQPCGTFWRRTVLYCGTDLEDARIEYLRNEAEDYGGGYGNTARETIIEQHESEPEEIFDTNSEEVDFDEE